jgi:hypothetical protein
MTTLNTGNVYHCSQSWYFEKYNLELLRHGLALYCQELEDFAGGTNTYVVAVRHAAMNFGSHLNQWPVLPPQP